jgi:capsular polysaccharide biosynthesis protein
LAPETLAGSNIESGSKEVYQDLLKKYNYLNVAIDMEKAEDVNYYAVVAAPTLALSPIAPKLFNFLGYGLASGVLLSLFWLLFDELARFSIVNAERRAKVWGVPLLGSVPSLRIGEPTLPIENQPEKQPNDWN